MFSHIEVRKGLIPTGIPWLPMAPGGWPQVRLKRIMQEVVEVVGEGWESTQLLALTKAGVIGRDINNLQGKVPASFDAYQVVEPLDLVFCLFDIDETPRTVGLVPIRGMITAAYTRFRTFGDALPSYIELLFRAMDRNKLMKPLYRGLRKSIRSSDLLATAIPLPPLDEQELIVTYLVHAQQRIDKAIAAKRRLTALLTEEKVAITEELVRRGCRQGAALRDSGVGWLGGVPEHWEVVRARNLFREVVVKSATGSETALSMSQQLGLVPSDQVERALTAQSMAGGKLVEPGDLVLNRLKAHLGVFAVADLAGVVSPDYTILRPMVSAFPTYFEHVLKSRAVRGELKVRARGIVEGFWRLYTNDFYEISLPCPPLEEQRAIVAQVRAAVSNSDRRIELTRREISLLEEFKARLIADVVTGQVDVRNVAAVLPRINPREVLVLGLDASDDDDEAPIDQELESA